MLVTKKFTFDSAHELKNYKGKCNNLHGHTYTLYVTVRGKIDKKSGMVIDFSVINKVVDEKILSILDHNYINKIIKQPTAENMLVWIWDQLKGYLNVYKLELWETPNCFATYYGK